MTLDEFKSAAEALRADGPAQVAAAATLDGWTDARNHLVGRTSGRLSELMTALGTLPKEDRREAGLLANAVKQELEALLDARHAELARAQQKGPAIDRTMPGRATWQGTVHPVSLVIDEVVEIFRELGFTIALGPEAEHAWYNFGALNFPADHPAMDLHDTLYVDEMVLRTHTSPVQVRTLQQYPPPIRILAPGNVYRADPFDASHAPMFSQVEGLVVDEGITFADLKATLTRFANRFFGETKTRFRPSYFPFTEPSAEMDVLCGVCKGSGCPVCKHSGWVEILGSGMVHPAVLESAGLDSERYTGWAFGMGPARTALARHGIPDIRILYDSDVRFLEQFAPMNLSHEWLKAFVPHALSAEQVRDLLTAHVATVEGFERLRADLAPFVVARVVETQKVPDTKLSFNQVDDGSGTLLEVVCGAPNVTAGAVYPFARTGTLMPAGFRIEKKKIRGFTSNGMLCSAAELGLGEDHAGILELTTDAAPGTPLLDVLPLGDVRLVLDVLPNRPDLLSHLGVARELSALTGVPMQHADGPHAAPVVDVVRDPRAATSGGATVKLEDPEGCPQYLGAVVRGVTVAPSPAWLRERVEAAGVRAINNVVDVTNAILHGLGHPMHAFDLATLAGQTVVIRRARAGEKMKTLDGVERALTPEMTMIADAARSIAVAGVMGGEESEVKATTTDLFLEVAYFDPKRTRLTRRALGLSTDASYRFERGIDPNGLVDAMRAAIGMIVAVAGGRLDGGVMAVGAAPAPRAAVTLRPARVKAVLGAEVSASDIVRYLTSVGFGVRGLGAGGRVEDGGTGEEAFAVTPPSWRHDVTREVDLIEEVARLHGYDRLPDTIEAYRPTTVPDHPLFVTSLRVRDALVAAGLAEVRPMPFVKGDDASHWRVTNPLAEDEPHLRVSLLESLARRAEYNLTRMHGDIRLFEVGSVFGGRGQGTGRGAGGRVIAEEVRAGVIIMGARHPQHFADGPPPVIDAWDAKGLAERVTRAAFPGAAIGLDPAADPALWTITVDARAVGTVSRVTLDAPVWASPAFGIELTLGAMPVGYVAPPGESVHAGVRPASAPPAPAVRYRPLPTTPAAAFDLALLVPDALSAAEVERVLRTSGGDMLESLALFDEFRGALVPDGMRSLAWRLTFRHPERTLRDKEIDGRRSQLLKSLENQLGVKPRTA